MDNKQTIVEYDISKKKKLLIYPLTITTFSIVMLYWIINAPTIKLYYLVMFIAVIIVCIYITYSLLKSIFNKNKIGLIVNDRILKFNGTPLARSIGEVEWKDIENIESSIQFNTKQIFIS